MKKSHAKNAAQIAAQISGPATNHPKNAP